MTPLLVLLGAFVGLGVVVILREFVPQQARLTDALQRLDTTPVPSARRARSDAGLDDGPQVKLGHWLERRLPARLRGQMLGPDLALLQRSTAHFLGEKALTALVGLMTPIVLTLTLSLMNTALGSSLSLPFVVPAAGSLLLAAVGFTLPDAQLKQRASVARTEFSRAVGAYIELVALKRRATDGATQALERAADVSDSWVFRRIREELRLSRISGVPAWDNLKDFSQEIGVNELADLADIMRLAGKQNAAVADTLSARSRSLRNALLNREKTLANADSERAVLPVAALGLIFVTLLAVPAALQIIG